MVCSHCGAESAADNQYCGKCGSTLGNADPTPRYPTRPSTIRREAAILGTALLLITATGLGIWYGLYYQRSPEMVVQRFVDADVQNQFARQNQYLIDRWDSKMVLSAFQTVRQHTGGSPFRDCRITGSTLSGNTAYVNVEVKIAIPSVPGVNTPLNAPAPPGPTTVPFAFVLSSEKGEWRIDGSQTLANATGAFAAAGYIQFAPLLNGMPNIKLPTLSMPGSIPNNTSPTTQPGSLTITPL
jgi:hypothetical protein